MWRKTSRNGFALIEVLVAASLSLVVVLAVQTLVVGSLQRTRAVERQLANKQDSDEELALLADDLASLAASPDLHVMNGRMWFASVNCMCVPTDSIRRTVRVEYAWWQPGSESTDGCLVRIEAPFDHPDQQHAVRLSKKVVGLEAAVSDGMNWHSTWPPATPRPARSIRVALRRNNGQAIQREYSFAPRSWKTHHD